MTSSLLDTNPPTEKHRFVILGEFPPFFSACAGWAKIGNQLLNDLPSSAATNFAIFRLHAASTRVLIWFQAWFSLFRGQMKSTNFSLLGPCMQRFQGLLLCCFAILIVCVHYFTNFQSFLNFLKCPTVLFRSNSPKCGHVHIRASLFICIEHFFL